MVRNDKTVRVVRLLVTGADGMLARAVMRAARERGHEVTGLSHDALDVTDYTAVLAQLIAVRPHAVIQGAAYTHVDDAESNHETAFRVNGLGAECVARACAALGAMMVYPSTDYVFSGNATAPYRPDDPVDPLNVYGASKVEGERAVRSTARHIIVRTSWLYGADGRNFAATVLKRARAGAGLRIVHDQRGSPTWTHDLAETMVELLERNAPSGTYHACNSGETSWYDFACTLLELAGVSAHIEAVATDDVPRPARRPAYSVLDCSATEPIVGPLRPWRAALRDALREGVG